MPLLAHVSDLHLGATPQALDRARRVLDHILTLPTRPDALLVTGDLADHAAPDEYAQAAELLARAGDLPVLVCPGNHDDRAALRAGLPLPYALPAEAADAPVNGLHVASGLAVCTVDSSVPGQDSGALSADTLAQAASALARLAPDTPAVLAFHHPPAPVGHPLPDSIGLAEPDRLAAWLHDRPQVIALLTGHAHTPAATAFAGRPLLVAPATVWQLRLPAEDGGAGLADLDAAPGYALHTVTGRQLTTHFRTVAA